MYDLATGPAKALPDTPVPAVDPNETRADRRRRLYHTRTPMAGERYVPAVPIEKGRIAHSQTDADKQALIRAENKRARKNTRRLGGW